MRTRYPIYVPTRGRAHLCRRKGYATTARLRHDSVPFNLVVVPSEVEEYADALGIQVGEVRTPDGNVVQVAGSDGIVTLLVLPSDNMVLRDSRNWCRDHAEAAGHAKHWQLDDNINEFRRLYRGRRIPCDAALALGACEDFSDRYENVAISGLNYQMFVTRETREPFFLNVHVYSCTLVNHAWEGRWRLVYNDDTDLCLQALSDGWCTVLLNAFMANKQRTMTTRGGNTNQLYEGDGRLVMAQALERAWPGVVTVDRRFGRPQHVVNWKRFDAPLRRKPDAPTGQTADVRLRQVGEVRSAALRELAEGES